MKTRSDLIVRTLELLNAIAAGQDPSAEDVQTIDSLIDGKLMELNKRTFYTSTSKTEFEDEFVDPLAIIIANTAAPSFGQPRNPDSVATAEATLLSLKPSSYVPMSTLQVEYF